MLTPTPWTRLRKIGSPVVTLPLGYTSPRRTCALYPKLTDCVEGVLAGTALLAGRENAMTPSTRKAAAATADAVSTAPKLNGRWSRGRFTIGIPRRPGPTAPFRRRLRRRP